MSSAWALYENIRQLLTMKGVVEKKGRHTTEADLGIIENASVVVDSKKRTILWVGRSDKLPSEYSKIGQRYSCEQEIWLPELVECHTHLIFGGHRHHDYARRCAGKTYQQIAQEGGGILSTLAQTRKADRDELFDRAMGFLEEFQRSGVGAVEIKSGYGLNLESELKILETIRELQEQTSVKLVATFMPAHAVPPEFKGKTSDYVNLICKEWIAEVAKRKLATFFDAFIEEGYFSVEEGRQMAEVAREHGLKLKFHVDQFKDLGGCAFGVQLGAVSLDHLDHSSEVGLSGVAKSDTVAVLLPGASLFTGTPYPNARYLLDHGARVAISTDFNPGTSPSKNLPLMTTIACSQMKMTIPEAIAGITYNAAAALGLENEFGALLPGRELRVCQFKGESYEVIPYGFGELIPEFG